MYNKLFTRILDSSIWLESHSTRIVWLTLLAAMDQDGMARFASGVNLARRAIVTPEEAAAALKVLESPDPHSSDRDNDGRRIERVPGGWIVLNASKYRAIVTANESSMLTKERAQRYRDRKRNNVTKRDEVAERHGVITQSGADTNAVSLEGTTTPLKTEERPCRCDLMASPTMPPTMRLKESRKESHDEVLCPLRGFKRKKVFAVPESTPPKGKTMSDEISKEAKQLASDLDKAPTVRRHRGLRTGQSSCQRNTAITPEMQASQFRPGVSGNPGGRLAKIFSAALVRLVERKLANDPEGRALLDAIAQQLVAKATKGDLASIRELADRIEGTPARSVTLGGRMEAQFLGRRTRTDMKMSAASRSWKLWPV